MIKFIKGYERKLNYFYGKMKLHRKITSIVLFFVMFLHQEISICLACEPCAQTLNFADTVRKSDLIIIGQKIKEGPPSDPGPLHGPEWIEVKALKVLKGSAGVETIKINSWQAMCSDYGIVVDEKSYVMFLAKKSPPSKDFYWEDYQYDAVDYGCSLKTLLAEGNHVDWEGQKLSLEDFVKKIKEAL